jgi:formyl-CoA transferase
MGAMGILMALHRRDANNDPRGEVIDITLFEPLFRLLEWQIPAYDTMGFVGTRRGNRFPFAPATVANTYLTSDDKWITLSTATQRAVDQCVDMIGEAGDSYRQHASEAGAADILDKALTGWAVQRTKQEVLHMCDAAGVVASGIYDVTDILADETFRLRGNVVTVDDRDFGSLRQPAPLPHFQLRPGAVWRQAPQLGEDNKYVYRDLLGVSSDELSRLNDAKVLDWPTALPVSGSAHDVVEV